MMVGPFEGWTEGYLNRATLTKNICKDKRGVAQRNPSGTYMELILCMYEVDLHSDQMLKIMEVHDRAAKAIQEIVGW